MRIYGMIQWWMDKAKIASFLSKLHVNAFKFSKQLSVKQDNLSKISKSDIVLFSVMKNEAHRLPFFIEYYRNLGVDHFILVDNASTDHFDQVVSGHDDITTFYTEGSYKDSNFGMHWANYLLRKYGTGHWCMTCDPDEFIVYPHMDTRNLKELTEYLSSVRQESFFTMMVDMYGDKPVEECHYEEGTNPVETCAYFDKAGYVKKISASLHNIWMQGGVRRRVFAKEKPEGAPALNKVTLVKWQRHFAYVESMHMALPRRLNECLDPRKTSGAVLHFKFISQLRNKVDVELEAKQHFNDSAEYKQYDKVIKERQELFDSTVSEKYEDWRTLAKLGMINKGEW
ncbi:glycosyltransferase family 2 protein [Halomonas binhaiensis]|uniref:Glycosyltransferase family 2 protein n=1 Tax=Halomonas binhaiensis TaxID=2562282 RepID=A0A856QQK1_9GAMM|nr:glycosyltransferase family 2 protein [Halomonas binhaiensis]QEM82176.2 glycosyltransferase family 2 protein [Halomonas binhaiensis]